jgi:acetyltransferase-like isoleucine patch superfamily enzyme
MKSKLNLLRIKIKSLYAKINQIYFKALGLNIKEGSVLGKIICDWPGNVFIGANCYISDYILLWIKNPFDSNNRIVIGDRVFIGNNCCFNCNSQIIIGSDCLIAADVKFVDINHEVALGKKINEQSISLAPITVQDDVWIGTGSIVLKGVTISTGAVVAAGAVVNKSIPANEIWGGVPAKKIGERKTI